LLIALLTLVFCLGISFSFLARLDIAMMLWLYPGLLLTAGLIIGRSFVLNGYLSLKENRLEEVAKDLYAADLWGSGIGALASGICIIPLWGLCGGLYFGAIVVLLCLIILHKK